MPLGLFGTSLVFGAGVYCFLFAASLGSEGFSGWALLLPVGFSDILVEREVGFLLSFKKIVLGFYCLKKDYYYLELLVGVKDFE